MGLKVVIKSDNLQRLHCSVQGKMTENHTNHLATLELGLRPLMFGENRLYCVDPRLCQQTVLLNNAGDES